MSDGKRQLRETALDRVYFNEYGDSFDRPYVVRALESFCVGLLDGDGCNLVEGEQRHVEKGSVFEIYSPSYTGNDVHLEGDGLYLELNWDDLKLFEVLEEGGYDDEI